MKYFWGFAENNIKLPTNTDFENLSSGFLESGAIRNTDMAIDVTYIEISISNAELHTCCTTGNNYIKKFLYTVDDKYKLKPLFLYRIIA